MWDLDWDWNDEDEEWARKAVDRHHRYIGFRIYTGFEIDGDFSNKKWFKSLHLQIYKWYDKEIIRWKIKKGLWD